jgi:hypothetical protein
LNNLTIKDELTDFLLYTTPNSDIKIETYLHNETVWLPQKRIAELFAVQRPAITKHLKNIFESGELEEDSVSSILEHTAQDGKNYNTKFYNLDVILSVGYRVNSFQATQFRIWATKILKEFIIKGFVIDDYSKNFIKISKINFYSIILFLAWKGSKIELNTLYLYASIY